MAERAVRSAGASLQLAGLSSQSRPGQREDPERCRTDQRTLDWTELPAQPHGEYNTVSVLRTEDYERLHHYN